MVLYLKDVDNIILISKNLDLTYLFFADIDFLPGICDNGYRTKSCSGVWKVNDMHPANKYAEEKRNLHAYNIRTL